MSARPLPREFPRPVRLGEGSTHPEGSCARCGAPIPPTRSGAPRRDARYCGPPCRAAATREARAAARDDIALAFDLLNRALRRLGIHPERPRRRPRS